MLYFGYEGSGTRAKWGPGRRNYYILHFVLEGKGYFNGNAVEKGMGFLIRPMDQVEYHSDAQASWQYFWISMDGQMAQKICKNHICTDANGVFTWWDVSRIRGLVQQLRERNGQLEPLYALSVLYQSLTCHEAVRQGESNPYVEKAKQVISLNLSKPLSVMDVAAACKVDDRYLYNLFIKHLGQSPKQYMNQLRLRNAEALLKESSCPVAEVAAAVGFEDPLAFSRFFARQVGSSPSAYRKAHRL